MNIFHTNAINSDMDPKLRGKCPICFEIFLTCATRLDLATEVNAEANSCGLFRMLQLGSGRGVLAFKFCSQIN